MTEFSILTDTAAWSAGFRERLHSGYRAAGLGQPAAEHLAERLCKDMSGWTVAAVSGGGGAGHVAVGVQERDGVLVGHIHDLTTAPGHAPAVRAWAEAWCAARGATSVGVRTTGPGTPFEEYPVRGQARLRVLEPGGPEPDGLTARPMTPTEYEVWLAKERASYVAGIVRSGALDEAGAERKSDRDFAQLLPGGFATADTSLLVLEAAGEPVGSAWLQHGHAPGITFGCSLYVDEPHRGKGYGRAAMAVGERAVLAAGDTALMFSVWGGNTVAMNLYDRAGYAVLDEYRSVALPN